LRHRLSSVWTRATPAGFLVFQAPSAARIFWMAVSSVKGGNGGFSSVACVIGFSYALGRPGSANPPHLSIEGIQGVAGSTRDASRPAGGPAEESVRDDPGTAAQQQVEHHEADQQQSDRGYPESRHRLGHRAREGIGKRPVRE
jgi:hypothetical protein